MQTASSALILEKTSGGKEADITGIEINGDSGSETMPLVPPGIMKAAIPASDNARRTVARARDEIRRILRREDSRLLVIAGPCSLHDSRSALEYAKRLRDAQERYSDRLLLVMRAYLEKPRTTIGWRGLVNDPHLDGSFDMATGLCMARRLLAEINDMGVPTATEMLDLVTPRYYEDLISWAAIGARTTEAQTHRALASGLPIPIGFKNGTDGCLQTAIDALISSRNRHSFLGVNDDGACCVVRTKGNPDGQLILRGGRSGPNFSSRYVEEAASRMRAAGVLPSLLIDCSHANSGSNHECQEAVWKQVLAERAEAGACSPVAGLMLESHLHAGKQSLAADPSALRYGVSITDACIDWETTDRMLRFAQERG